jgi:hypothetical protein
MLIKKSDVKSHLAARRARHMQLLSKLPGTLGSGGDPVQPEPVPASAHGSTLEPIRLVPRVNIPPVMPRVPAVAHGVSPAVQKPTYSNGTATVFKLSK